MDVTSSAFIWNWFAVSFYLEFLLFTTESRLLEKIGEERSLIRTIKTRQQEVDLRGESLLKTVIKGKC